MVGKYLVKQLGVGGTCISFSIGAEPKEVHLHLVIMEIIVIRIQKKKKKGCFNDVTMNLYVAA